MLTKIIDWLYWKYGSRNIVAMTRRQMLGVTQEFDVSELGAADQKTLAVDAETVLMSPAYLTAVNNVKKRLMAHIQDEAADASIIFFDRFSVNGVKLVEEELQNYATLHVETSDINFIED